MYPTGGDKKAANRQMVEAATQRKAVNDTQYFWDLVQRHMNGHYVGPRKMPRHAEENFLFTKKAEQVSTGCIDDNIPVERSGPKSDEIATIEAFAELRDSVPSSVLKCFELLRFDRPSPIQKHSIPLGLAGLDLVCCAQTGSGKTFAFLVPLVTALDHNFAHAKYAAPENSEATPKHNGKIVTIDRRGALPRAIVLAPTRELASQIQLDARRLTFGSSLKSVCVYGGNDIRTQLQELAGGCDLIVATPGRLNDLVDRGCVSLSQVHFLVLDEADRMLDMGFEPQIRKIVEDYDMPRGEERQTFMFSATFPSEIQKLARDFLRNYVWIAVGRVGSTVENIKQQVILSSADPHQKLSNLIQVLNHSDGRTLIFVQKKKTATWLVDCLRAQYNVTAEEIHGDRSQSQREYALRMFREGNIRILVATDVAARGLDVPQVMHVIQFDMPLSAEDFDVYVHRIGRTGRAGMTGLATCLFVPGKETGEGNGRIAPQLLTLLQENNQEVPDWFLALDDLQQHHHGHHHNGNRRFNNNYNQRGGGRFGFSDARAGQHNTLYSAKPSSGGYPSHHHQQPRNGYAPYNNHNSNNNNNHHNNNSSYHSNYNNNNYHNNHQQQHQNHHNNNRYNNTQMPPSFTGYPPQPLASGNSPTAAGAHATAAAPVPVPASGPAPAPAPAPVPVPAPAPVPVPVPASVPVSTGAYVVIPPNGSAPHSANAPASVSPTSHGNSNQGVTNGNTMAEVATNNNASGNYYDAYAGGYVPAENNGTAAGDANVHHQSQQYEQYYGQHGQHGQHSQDRRGPPGGYNNHHQNHYNNNNIHNTHHMQRGGNNYHNNNTYGGQNRDYIHNNYNNSRYNNSNNNYSNYNHHNNNNNNNNFHHQHQHQQSQQHYQNNHHNHTNSYQPAHHQQEQGYAQHRYNNNNNTHSAYHQPQTQHHHQQQQQHQYGEHHYQNAQQQQYYHEQQHQQQYLGYPQSYAQYGEDPAAIAKNIPVTVEDGN